MLDSTTLGLLQEFINFTPKNTPADTLEDALFDWCWDWDLGWNDEILAHVITEVQNK
jgi:hypothetical protein